MTREEIKEELLNNEQQQTNITINAQFISLYTLLIRKGIMTKNDIEEMEKLTQEYIEKLNNKLIDKIEEEFNKEEENE